jgi:hypothetical protein
MTPCQNFGAPDGGIAATVIKRGVFTLAKPVD